MDVLKWFQKAAPVRPARDAPASPMYNWGGDKRVIITYAEAVTAELALQHPIIFRALDKIAKSVSSVRWYAEADAELPASERAGATVIKALNSLLQSPNDTQTYNELLYWMALNWACYGRVPFKVGVGAVAPYVANGIYPLSARYVTAQRNGRGAIAAYMYGPVEQGATLPTRRFASAGAAYAYEVRRPNLAGTDESKENVAPLIAIGLPSQVVNLLLQRAADTASGHPNTKYIVATDKTLTGPQKDQSRKQIENSAVDGETSGQVLFLTNVGKLDVHKLDNDLGDIHSKMPLDDMARMIFGAFDIPIALAGLGAADGAKFASNYEGSNLAFWEGTIIPGYLVPLATGLTAAICPPGAKVCFDLDTIPAIASKRITQAVSLSQVNYLKRNEKRAMTGWEPLTDAEGGNEIDQTGKAAADPNAAASQTEPNQPGNLQ